MLFNSIDFAIFLPVVFFIYWVFGNKNLRVQNFIIVISSYFFYGYWDWRFLSLIFLSTLVDYFIGGRLKNQQIKSKRKILLILSLSVNLGILIIFKYYNFFLENFVNTFSLFGVQISSSSLNIILPVGISFYTFQTLSYTIDIYNKRLEPTQDFIAFASFVCFFPQLVAGPIERAINLLPQFNNKRTFVYFKAVDGLNQILWGLFKKVVIADSCSVFVNEIFTDSQNMDGISLFIGALLFSVQVYGDFSGYSDIAIGTSKLFGFRLMQNFSFPYFSRSILEFWKRWHISLTSWFTDYLFTPLALNLRDYKLKGLILSITITFFLSGLWHGAKWTFIVWGILHSIYYLITILMVGFKIPKKVVAFGKNIPTLKEFSTIALTFILVSFANIFFRAENLNHAFNIIYRIFNVELLSLPKFFYDKSAFILLSLILIFFLIEWLGRVNKYATEKIFVKNKNLKNIFLHLLIILIIWFSINSEPQEFIYFQF